MKLCTVETAIEITNDYIFSPLLLYQTLTAQIPVQALALQTHIPELSHSAFLSKTPLAFFLQTLSCIALTVATMTANSRCAYIFHNPKKPDSLQQLKKF